MTVQKKATPSVPQLTRTIMSLRNFSMNTAPDVQPEPAPPTELHATDAVDNVVQLPVDRPAGLKADHSNTAQTKAPAHAVNEPEGLMAAPAVVAFFGQNFFGFGRYDGARYRSQEAQTQGRAALASAFQNALSGVICQKQLKVDGLRNMELQTEGLCSIATRQLRLACERLEREIADLKMQIDLAAQGQGWVLAALNEYQVGFGKGLREAIDAAVLGL
jgi:hypothetical protein